MSKGIENNKLDMVFYSVTERCNSRCGTCSYWENRDGKDELTFQEINELLEQIGKFEPEIFIFTGGEPLLRKDLFDITTMLREKLQNTSIRLVSNGLLLKKYIKEIIEMFDRVVISFDAENTETYKKIRGVNGFSRIMEGIKSIRMLSQNLVIKGRCVVQKDNYRKLPEIIKVAKETGLNQISFLIPDVTSSTALGRDGNIIESSNIRLDSTEIDELEQIIESLSDEDYKFIEQSKNQLNKALIQQLRGSNFKPRCNAPLKTISIAANGDIYPCFFLDPVGNIRESTLNKVLSSKKAVTLRQMFKKRLLETCKGCACPQYI